MFLQVRTWRWLYSGWLSCSWLLAVSNSKVSWAEAYMYCLSYSLDLICGWGAQWNQWPFMYISPVWGSAGLVWISPAVAVHLSSFCTSTRGGIPSSCFRVCSLQSYHCLLWRDSKKRINWFKMGLPACGLKEWSCSKPLFRNDWELISKFVWGGHCWGWGIAADMVCGKKGTMKGRRVLTLKKKSVKRQRWEWLWNYAYPK